MCLQSIISNQGWSLRAGLGGTILCPRNSEHLRAPSRTNNCVGGNWLKFKKKNRCIWNKMYTPLWKDDLRWRLWSAVLIQTDCVQDIIKYNRFHIWWSYYPVNTFSFELTKSMSHRINLHRNEQAFHSLAAANRVMMYIASRGSRLKQLF